MLWSRERGVLIQGSLCLPLKSGVFLALLGAPVESSKGLVGPRSLRSQGPIKLSIPKNLLSFLKNSKLSNSKFVSVG